MNVVRKHFFILFLASTLLACQARQDLELDRINGETSGLFSNSNFSERVFRVLSETGEPILAAQVLIGMEVNVPFAQNMLTTGVEGEFIAPELWVNAEPVTIEAPGYVRATYFDVSPNEARVFHLKKKQVPVFTFELTGVATGFQVKNRDGFVDFGLTIPVVKPEDLFQFNLDMILSPYTDPISILGQKVEVPGNVTLPQQKERYIIPFTIEKPTYRIGFAEGGVKHLISLAGTFPIKPVIDAFRSGSSFTDVINAFNMQGLSMHEVTVTQKNQRLDLRMNQHILNQTRRVKAPVFNQHNEVVIAASIATHPQGLFPVDVKRINSNQLQVLKTFGAEPKALTILRNKDEFDGKIRSERLSASLEPWLQDGHELKLLPLLRDPVLKNTHSFDINLVAVPSGYYESGALYKLSSVKQVKDRNGVVTSEEKSLFWEVYSPKWSAHVELPKFPGLAMPSGHKRWSASLFASKVAALRVRSMKTLTQGEVSHVTHANVDFQ